MKSLNLVYPNQSEIKYTHTKYPDGQQDITISYSPLLLADIEHNNIAVNIKSRFNSWKDLELIVCATKALRRLKVKEIHLYIPYILGERSDRQFVSGGTSYLVDVIAPILNGLNFETITCIDAHSDVAQACIPNLVVENNLKLVEAALANLTGIDFTYLDKDAQSKVWELFPNLMLMSPDGGALKKIYKIAEQIGYNGEVLTCSKYRDEQGKLSKTFVPVRIDHYNKNIIIIDDICDGGKTFNDIVSEIDKAWPERENKIYLIVTHGIFSKGFEELNKYFKTIYCTNSISDIGSVPVEHKKDHSILNNTLVRQLNVF